MNDSAEGDRQEQVLHTERAFQRALVEADLERLERVMVDDFTMSDLAGTLQTKRELMERVRSGELRFISMTLVEQAVRLYGDTAVVTGRTQMVVEYRGAAMEIPSRFTHVYREQAGEWRLVAAQGTPVAG